MTTEADARILIDKLLEHAGWSITDKAQVSTEEAVADGRADYLLKDTRSRPLAVLDRSHHLHGHRYPAHLAGGDICVR
ncbi:MAG: hypothetical protein LUO80_07800 [Methylococcaceae bacterium]|jgi:predicted type IV restriction endonuclease|nr:hypothetical protein [Methylococcaceae bacterium]